MEKWKAARLSLAAHTLLGCCLCAPSPGFLLAGCPWQPRLRTHEGLPPPSPSVLHVTGFSLTDPPATDFKPTLTQGWLHLELICRDYVSNSATATGIRSWDLGVSC